MRSLVLLLSTSVTVTSLLEPTLAAGQTASDAGALAPATSALAPGELTDRNGGTLRIANTKQGLSFAIRLFGQNGHSCEIDGAIRGQRGVVPSTPACVVTFTPAGARVSIEATEACELGYCGARAHLRGEFERAPTGCAPSEVDDRRRKFAKLYGEKKYPEALKALEPVLVDCADFVRPVEVRRVRNDLAIAMFHVGRLADCRDVLAPLLELARATDQAIRHNNADAPGDGELEVLIAQAARFNAKKCGLTLADAGR